MVAKAEAAAAAAAPAVVAKAEAASAMVAMAAEAMAVPRRPPPPRPPHFLDQRPRRRMPARVRVLGRSKLESGKTGRVIVSHQYM